jgi:hypothetical protein
MSALVKVCKNVYKPSFDETSGSYYDECPYLPYQRIRETYECPCKCGFTFSCSAEFNSHIKSKTHAKWVKEYKDTSKNDSEIKNLRILIGQLENRNRILTKKYIKLESRNQELMDECSKKRTENLKLLGKLVKTNLELKCVNEENKKLNKQFIELDEEEERICKTGGFSDEGDLSDKSDEESEYDEYEYLGEIHYVDNNNNLLDPEFIKKGEYKKVGYIKDGIPIYI